MVRTELLFDELVHRLDGRHVDLESLADAAGETHIGKKHGEDQFESGAFEISHDALEGFLGPAATHKLLHKVLNGAFGDGDLGEVSAQSFAHFATLSNCVADAGCLKCFFVFDQFKGGFDLRDLGRVFVNELGEVLLALYSLADPRVEFDALLQCCRGGRCCRKDICLTLT